MACELRFQHEKDQRETISAAAPPIDRQNRKGRQAQQDEIAPSTPGGSSRVSDSHRFRAPKNQQHQRYVRVGNRPDDVLANVFWYSTIGGGKMQGLFAASKRVISRPSSCLTVPPVRLIRSISFGSRASRSVYDSASRTVFSASAMLRPRQAARLRIGAAASFWILFRSRYPSASVQHHRMRRSGIRPRGHRRDVAGLEEEEAGRSRARAGGRDQGDDRYRRSEDLLDDLPHCVGKAPGGAQPDQYDRGMLSGALAIAEMISTVTG